MNVEKLISDLELVIKVTRRNWMFLDLTGI